MSQHPSNPTASIQVLVGVIRVHPPGGRQGDSYTWACSCEIVGDTAYLYGAMAAPKPSERRAIRQALIDIGVRRVEYERKNTKLARVIRTEI